MKSKGQSHKKSFHRRGQSSSAASMNADAYEEDEGEQDVCPRCGMSRDQWPGGSASVGYMKGGVAYCCQGCAENTGCICDDIQGEKLGEDDVR